MPFRTLLAVTLLGAGLSAACHANAAQAGGPIAVGALQAASGPRYELGAVVDVRQASTAGATVLAITPGGAADRLGLRAGDKLRAINGRRLDDTAKPSSTLDSALQEGDGALRVEAVRNGKTLALSGRADLAVHSATQAGARSCGHVSTLAGVVPRSKGVFQAEITQIDGNSTPLQPSNRHRVKAGKHVLVVRESIDPARLSPAQLQQIAKMKKFAMARAYKSLVIDVEPGIGYRIGARLLKDKLDTQSIRDNAYWEPVVWEEVPEACP
jgi:hypothetical protein